MPKNKKLDKNESKDLKEQRKAIQEVLKKENKVVEDEKADKKNIEKKPENIQNEKPKGKVDAVQEVKKEVKEIKPISPIKSEKKPRRFFKIILIIFLLIVLAAVIFLVVFGVGIYKYKWQNSFANNLVKYVPYPVLLLDYKIVKYQDYKDVLGPIKHYLEQQLKVEQDQKTKKDIEEYLKEDNLNKVVLNKLVYDNFRIKESQKFGVVVTQAEIDSELDNIIKQAPGGKADVEKTLLNFFNWTTDQFKKYVLVPYLYNNKLQDKISQDEKINGEAKKKAEDVLALVKKGEESFENLAEKYSEDLTASNGGDIGIFGKGEMDKEFEDAAYNLEPNQISDLVRTKDGYHIIKLIEKIKNDDGSFRLHVKDILIKTKNIDQWLSEEIAKSKVIIILPGYKWEKSCGKVLAKNENCNSENNLQLPSNLNIQK